ncbi:MAG: hypothetical protein A3D24_03710 [Candidatus Blackburnbacteria bacterium RIFCSPHIGHO2_02_FULL_39_13]|uniref:Uncharacterized protein n=1 Tax=Candidatus Blackburnbacteria bacterium RIFCSPLOWO2_01_FULL_40_20 TaxID=1797519 RepID=A0A1G1VET6_9BACT|nr:MAG: hypothetical protein A2694_01310 [Candidatus Blackburnbacteria bacterium RIFCSPHIGHO2_01_FULL_40_17]OGY10007.1 MAG: hypothetical protein A3D24_03710 [Candidatus Blackburnbacteria bacterium RIFCSPHIGHO2_02_FULL_39_13]OGY13950.1 MAG: hypothetical protein A3A77_04100 [Candidatus Blackburnbacteria bacterium RIFCSPLOWO2_01_FULL_40_20]
MSKVFYDKYLVFEEIEIELGKLNLEKEERQEIEVLIDEMIHHRMMDKILSHLPREHHEEFLDKFHKIPYDESLLQYLDERIETSVEQHIKDEMQKLKKEILEDIKTSCSPK